MDDNQWEARTRSHNHDLPRRGAIKLPSKYGPSSRGWFEGVLIG